MINIVITPNEDANQMLANEEEEDLEEEESEVENDE